MANIISVVSDSAVKLIEGTSTISDHVVSAGIKTAKILDNTAGYALASNVIWVAEGLGNLSKETREYVQAYDSTILLPELPKGSDGKIEGDSKKDGEVKKD